MVTVANADSSSTRLYALWYAVARPAATATGAEQPGSNALLAHRLNRPANGDELDAWAMIPGRTITTRRLVSPLSLDINVPSRKSGAGTTTVAEPVAAALTACAVEVTRWMLTSLARSRSARTLEPSGPVPVGDIVPGSRRFGSCC